MRVPLQLRVEPVEWWNVAILPGSPFFTGLLHFHLLFHPTSSVHVHWILPQLNQKDRWSKRQVFPVVYHGRRVFFFFAKTEVSQFLCISSSFQIWPHPPCVHVGVFLLILYGSCSALSCSHVTRTSNVYQQYLHRQRKKHRTSNTFNRKKKKGTLWNTIVLAASSRGQQSESSASMLPPRLPPLLKSLLIFSGLFCLPGSYRCVRNLKTGVKLNIL